MLKFFRKIRENLLSDGKTGKYFKYAIGEISLVVIGILIALYLNNLKENFQDQKTEFRLLSELQDEIIENKKHLEEVIQRHEAAVTHSESILKLFHNQEINLSDSELDSLLLFAITRAFNTFDPNQGQLKSIINSGQINLISDRSLVNFISKFEDKARDAIEGTGIVRQTWISQMGPVISRYYRYDDLNGIKSKFRPDYEGFFKDPEVEYWLRHHGTWTSVGLREHKELLLDMEDALSIIEEELKSHNP